MSDAAPLIECVEVEKTYEAGRVRALRGATMSVAEGEWVAVMGSSGSGKSTLLNVIGTLDEPTAGVVRVAGEDIARLADPDGFRARVVGFVFQAFHLLPTLTASENVTVPMIELPMRAGERARKAADLLGAVGLAARAHARPRELSGGERQRVALARGLANDPRLLLADEPTGNLDTATAADLAALLRGFVRDRRLTVLMVTHDPAMASQADRIVRLRDGRVVEA